MLTRQSFLNSLCLKLCVLKLVYRNHDVTHTHETMCSLPYVSKYVFSTQLVHLLDDLGSMSTVLQVSMSSFLSFFRFCKHSTLLLIMAWMSLSFCLGCAVSSSSIMFSIASTLSAAVLPLAPMFLN